MKVIYTSDHFMDDLTEGDAVYMYCDACYEEAIEADPYTWRSEEIVESFHTLELAQSRLSDLLLTGRRHSRAGCVHHKNK